MCRTFGHGDRAIVLLHGLVSSGDQFGGQFDALGRHARVLAPDMLGFGGSCGAGAGSYGLDDHLQALEEAIDAAGLGSARLTLAGHSLGAIVALHLAARRASQVDRVVMWSPPIARDRHAAKDAIRRMGLLERLFALDGPLARTACQAMCRYRGAAALLAVALNPSVPVALSLGSVRHTWPAYRDTMDGVVLDQAWRDALERLCDEDVPVLVAAGDRDDVADTDLHRRLARDCPSVDAHTAPGAGHLLPITHADWCVAHLTAPQPARRIHEPPGHIGTTTSRSGTET